MSVVPVVVTLSPYARRELVEAFGGSTRELSLASVTAEPVMSASVHLNHEFGVFLLEGQFYAPIKQGLPSEGSLANDMNRYVGRFNHARPGSVVFERFLKLESAIVIVNGIPCEPVQEPFWVVNVDNSQRGGRPSQIRCELLMFREFPQAIPPSDPPRIAFSANRGADAQDLVARLHELHPRSTLIPIQNRCVVIDPSVLQADTLTLSVRALSRALLESAHRAIPILPRAALEAWMGLRGLVSAGDPVAFARAATTLSTQLRLRSSAEDQEAQRWKSRAQMLADLLALRLAAEPDLVRDDEIDLLAASDGPRP